MKTKALETNFKLAKTELKKEIKASVQEIILAGIEAIKLQFAAYFLKKRKN